MTRPRRFSELLPFGQPLPHWARCRERVRTHVESRGREGLRWAYAIAHSTARRENPAAAATQGIGGPLLELKLSESNWCRSISGNKTVAEIAQSLAGSSLCFRKWQGLQKFIQLWTPITRPELSGTPHPILEARGVPFPRVFLSPCKFPMKVFRICQ